MTYRDTYMEKLRQEHPGRPDGWYELAWRFRSPEKAELYGGLLAACNVNADIAGTVVRRMYVSGDIDIQTALSEKFIRLLLSLTCMDRSSKPHSVAYHIRKMLRDDEVRAERRRMEEQRMQHWRSGRQENSTVSGTEPPSQRKMYVVEIPDPTADKVQKLMQWAKESGSSVFETVDIAPKNQGIRLSLSLGTPQEETVCAVPCGGGYLGLMKMKVKVKVRKAALSATLAGLRSVFGPEEPWVRYRSGRRRMPARMPMSRALRLMERDMTVYG